MNTQLIFGCFFDQTAELLFFVIDNQTRSTASMVEAAYLAGELGICSPLDNHNFLSQLLIHSASLQVADVSWC